MGVAKTLCKQLGTNSDDVLERMMSGNYENLINVFEKEFGDLVDLKK